MIVEFAMKVFRFMELNQRGGNGKFTDVTVKLEHALSSVRSRFDDQATKRPFLCGALDVFVIKIR